MKVAVLEVGHWHAPLARVGLERAGVDVIAVTARAAAAAQPWAARFGARVHGDAASLLAGERPDFVFVFDHHAALATTARAVIERGIACSIEKPGGMNAAEVAMLVDLHRQRGVFASVPFVNRLGPIARDLRTHLDAARLGAPIHGAFVDIAGSPLRYPAMGCAWMLDPALAGGGCLLNLGVHFVDLFAFVTGRPARLAGAALSRAIHGGPMEDHARLLLTNDAGGSALVEVAYCFPDDEERHTAVTFAGKGWFADARADRCTLTIGATPTRFDCALDAAPLYADYVVATLRAASTGAAPVARLEDLHAVMTIVDAAYALDRARG
jgi:predicted dehydrogenase